MVGSDSKQKLSDIAYQEMLSLIRDGTWSAKSRLPSEQDMSEKFGVSRPVIRQALARLREEGVIQSRRGSGSFVMRELGAEVQYPSIASIDDLAPFISFREGVEGEAAAMAAERRTSDQLNSLRELCVFSPRATGEESANQDFAFHIGVAEASGNPFYRNTLLTLGNQVKLCMSLTWNISVLTMGFHETETRQHTELVDAIEAKDPERARQRMRNHVRWAYSRFMHGQAGKDD